MRLNICYQLIIKLMNILDLSLYITNNKLEEKNKEGKIITGLLYVDNKCKPLTEIMDLPDKPLNTLEQDELCPGSEILEEINKGLS